MTSTICAQDSVPSRFPSFETALPTWRPPWPRRCCRSSFGILGERTLSAKLSVHLKYYRDFIGKREVALLALGQDDRQSKTTSELLQFHRALSHWPGRARSWRPARLWIETFRSAYGWTDHHLGVATCEPSPRLTQAALSMVSWSRRRVSLSVSSPGDAFGGSCSW